MNCKNILKKIYFLNPFIISALTLFFSCFLMAINLNGPIEGDINKHILSAKMFGVPAELREHGIRELYVGQKQTGWDGQFYYYISNDLLGQKDTKHHIDADAYRYQRIGLPILSKVLSLLLFQSWVSPTVFFLTSLILVVLAAFVGSSYLIAAGFSSILILFWTMGLGTQLTMLSALPDAAADALIIVALVSILRNKKWVYFFFVTFAALSREVYIFFPLSFLVVAFVEKFSTQKSLKETLLATVRQNYVHTVPFIIFVLWQVYIRVHFGISPSAQGYGILDIPFKNLVYYGYEGLSGTHPLVPHGEPSRIEGRAILLFLILLVASIYRSMRLIWISRNAKNWISMGIGLGWLGICLLYCCFGHTVMMHHSGYMKAAHIFFFFLPLSYVLTGEKFRFYYWILFIYCFYFFDNQLWQRIRVEGSPERYLGQRELHFVDSPPACLHNYKASLEVISTKPICRKTFFEKIFMRQKVVAKLKLKNISGESFQPSYEAGGFKMSYQWIVNGTDEIAVDGVRSDIPDVIKNGEEVEIPMVIVLPRNRRNLNLILSPVQEGCSWFYQFDKESGINMPVEKLNLNSGECLEI